MNDILFVIGVAYAIVFPALFLGWLEGMPDKFVKVIFWPIWVIVEISLSAKEWYREIEERYKEI